MDKYMFLGSILVLAFICSPTQVFGEMRVGGITDNERPVTPEMKEMFLVIEPQVKNEISQSMNGSPVQSVEPISYKSQVVAGVNYFVKYQVDHKDLYFHARIYRNLQREVSLVRIEGPKKKNDPISYF